MRKIINDLINDLVKWLGDLMSAASGLLKEFKGNPVIRQIGENIRKSFASFFSYLGSFFKKTDLAHVALWSVAGVLIFSVLSVAVFFEIADRWDKRSYLVNIPNGYGASQVGDLLLYKGIITNRYSFNILVSVFGLESGIQAGAYRFSPSMGLGSIVLKLKNGDIISPPLAKVVFPEGTSIYKMGMRLKDSGVGDGESFKYLVENATPPELVEKFPFLKGVQTESLEGYLFPDTYYLPYEITVPALRDLMLSRFSAVVMPVWNIGANDTRLSLHEIVTLASIIEKEAAVDEERAIISSVFHNRLRKRMYLSADPTVKYALSEYRKPTKKVYYIDLEVDSPYNTYKNLGLPPGPICNPGLASIKAAIYPALTDYLYFVARRDGTHVFSETWQEHERAKISVRGK